MGSISLVGLREDESLVLPQAVVTRLRAADSIVVPSPSAADTLREAGVESLSLADLGIEVDAHVSSLVRAVVELGRTGDVALVATGFPLVRVGLVTGLLAAWDGPLHVAPFDSHLDALMLVSDADPAAEVDIVDARVLREAPDRRGAHLIITGIENAILARKVAGRLAEAYPPEHAVVLATRVGDGSCERRATPVGERADAEVGGADTAAHVAPWSLAPPSGFDELVRIMAMLRGSDGCPWDLEQTHESLRGSLIEEAYEVLGAIDAGDDAALADELGDILLQVVFHAQIASEEGTFTIDDSVRAIVEKLRRRHPHIFGGTTVADASEVMHRWEAIKREEKRGEGILDSVPTALPSLLAAQKISRKAAATGFDWETVDDVWTKVHEEIEELKETDAGSPEAADEVGDLLFTVVNVARKHGVDAETALRDACEKFKRRFGHMEAAAAARGERLEDLGVGEMEDMWADAKREEGQ